MIQEIKRKKVKLLFKSNLNLIIKFRLDISTSLNKTNKDESYIFIPSNKIKIFRLIHEDSNKDDSIDQQPLPVRLYYYKLFFLFNFIIDTTKDNKTKR